LRRQMSTERSSANVHFWKANLYASF